ASPSTWTKRGSARSAKSSTRKSRTRLAAASRKRGASRRCFAAGSRRSDRRSQKARAQLASDGTRVRFAQHVFVKSAAHFEQFEAARDGAPAAVREIFVTVRRVIRNK